MRGPAVLRLHIGNRALMFFRILSIIGLLGTIAIVMSQARKPPAASAAPRPRLRVWEKFLYVLVVLSLAVLAITGLLNAILQGPGSLRGLGLWFHFAAAPMFLLTLFFLILAWAERCRFGPARQAEGTSIAANSAGVPTALPPRFSTAARVLFWCVAVFGFLTVGSIIISMMPIFASQTQYSLYQFHRYCALFLTMSVIGHACVLWRRRQTRPADASTPARSMTSIPPANDVRA